MTENTVLTPEQEAKIDELGWDDMGADYVPGERHFTATVHFYLQCTPSGFKGVTKFVTNLAAGREETFETFEEALKWAEEHGG